MIYIGIDPAMRKGGFAACKINTVSNEVEFIKFLNFEEFVDWSLTERAWGLCGGRIAIENSNLQKCTFSSVAKAAQHRNVGQNMGFSACVVGLCNALFGKINVIEYSPKQKGAKWSDGYFQGIIKTKGYKILSGYKSNLAHQDERDAFKLAFLASLNVRDYGVEDNVKT